MKPTNLAYAAICLVALLVTGSVNARESFALIVMPTQHPAVAALSVIEAQPVTVTERAVLNNTFPDELLKIIFSPTHAWG